MSDRGSYRSTYSAMLDSKEFLALSSDARLILYTVKHSRLTNMAGIFLCGPGDLITISDLSGLSAKKVSKAIRELSDTHWIGYREGILWVRNQLRFDPHISLANEKHRAGIQKIVSSLQKSEILAKFCEYYDLTYPFDRVSIPIRSRDPDPDPEREPEPEKETEKEREFLQLSTLKIKKSYYDNLCKEFPTVNHEEELKCAELYRQSKPGKGKGEDHLFLRNWFKNAIKFKEQKGGDGKKELNKYDNL